MKGFLCVDKPAGIPSFRAVSVLRRLTGEKRVGFAGTLDPFATGLLIVAIGREYTRQLDAFHAFPKTYQVTWILGKTTTTLDPEGAFTEETPYIGTEEALKAAILGFKGPYLQTPPQFSAKKIQGKAAYHHARAGQTVALQPVPVEILDLNIQTITWGEFPEITMTVTCGKGTYIRSLIADMAASVGSVGYCTALRRLQMGEHRVENAVSVNKLEATSIASHLFETVSQSKVSSKLGIGVFDGLHLGHQQIAQHCTALLTFDPHPDHVLNKNKDIPDLTTKDELSQFGIPILVQEFSKELAALDPITFLEDIILKKYNPKAIIVGYDFVFGRNRAGDCTLLKKWADSHQIDVIEVSAVTYENEIVSSSAIRQLIMAGDIEKANARLGHSYLIRGVVVAGERRGRELGFPTANIKVHPQKCLPPLGVYRAIVDTAYGRYNAGVYIGTKPTFNGNEITVEAHLFEFAQDIYGQTVNIWIEAMIRPQMQFESPQALINQITLDLEQMKKQFRSTR